jgi:4-amino-4-deoxy-L-arabinose transferase-like glycosyltransferase
LEGVGLDAHLRNASGSRAEDPAQQGLPLKAKSARLLVELLVLAGLALVLALPRLPGLGRFVTPDEPIWARRSASFYYALSHQEYGETNLTGHPGVTTMWAGALAYAQLFPRYARVGQLQLGDTRLLELFQRQGPLPLELLAAARRVVALICIAALLFSFVFARRLFGLPLALGMFALVAFDPFHVSHSRYLHTNGLLASFMLLSLLALVYYLHQRSLLALLVSGAAAGLAVLSITPGLMIVPAAALLMACALRDPGTRRWDLSPSALARRLVLPLGLWGLTILATIFAAWPAMWVHPVDTLLSILRYGFSAAEGQIGSAGFVAAYTSDYDPAAKYFYFYPLSFLWRTTPAVSAGLILALPAVWQGERSPLSRPVRRALTALLVFALTYTVLMSFGSKKFDRYLLPIYLPVDLVAGAGWYAAAAWLSSRLAPRWKAAYSISGLLLIVSLFQAAGTLRTYPFYNTYFNPLMGGLAAAPRVMSVGWGEGLQDAALFLQKQPDIRHKIIYTWYSLAFDWYAAGLGFQAELVDVSDRIPMSQYLASDYIVVYVNQAQRHTPPALLDYLAAQKPIYVARIDGVDFAWVYQMQPARSAP